uniref:Uncharacterized protein n=1 Tax=Ditylum brightwellii TaxID=49249 RepID=A0A7S4RTU0_9STRA
MTNPFKKITSTVGGGISDTLKATSQGVKKVGRSLDTVAQQVTNSSKTEKAEIEDGHVTRELADDSVSVGDNDKKTEQKTNPFKKITSSVGGGINDTLKVTGAGVKKVGTGFTSAVQQVVDTSKTDKVEIKDEDNTSEVEDDSASGRDNSVHETQKQEQHNIHDTLNATGEDIQNDGTIDELKPEKEELDDGHVAKEVEDDSASGGDDGDQKTQQQEQHNTNDTLFATGEGVQEDGQGIDDNAQQEVNKLTPEKAEIKDGHTRKEVEDDSASGGDDGDQKAKKKKSPFKKITGAVGSGINDTLKVTGAGIKKVGQGISPLAATGIPKIEKVKFKDEYAVKEVENENTIEDDDNQKVHKKTDPFKKIQKASDAGFKKVGHGIRDGLSGTGVGIIKVGDGVVSGAHKAIKKTKRTEMIMEEDASGYDDDHKMHQQAQNDTDSGNKNIFEVEIEEVTEAVQKWNATFPIVTGGLVLSFVLLFYTGSFYSLVFVPAFLASKVIQISLRFILPILRESDPLALYDHILIMQDNLEGVFGIREKMEEDEKKPENVVEKLNPLRHKTKEENDT